MFGYKLVPNGELKLAEARLTDLKHMLGRMEEELSYWRTRADDERMRADRIADAERLDRGLNEVSEPVLREKRKSSSIVDEEFQAHQNEISEMFSDSFDSEDELNWVDPDLAVAAAGWMETAKAAREKKSTEEDE